MKIKYLFCLLTACLLAFAVSAQQLPEPMKPARLVNDFAGMLTPQQQNTLEQKLENFDRTSSNQIAVVTVDDLQGMAVSDYAARLFDKWGIGGKKNDNGILILVKPKTATEKGEVFIATGYGLEGAVPDALAGRIVDYDILPSFRKGDYYGGLNAATDSLIGLTTGEYTADEYLKRKERSGLLGAGVSILILVFFFLVMSAGARRRRKHYTMSGDDSKDAAARGLLWGWPFLLGGGRHHGGGGFGGFSGGGFGGFGGFGGGMTGGGGAGGSW